MNVLILVAGTNQFDTHDGSYPFCLAEIDGVPLIERVIKNCMIRENARFIVALRKEEIQRFHLDNIVKLITSDANILSISSETKGAACTALLATGFINTDEELLILNGNDLLDADFSAIISSFHDRNLEAGIVTFPSVHPRYSYVRLNSEGFVIEAAEKNPISRHATAGFYWFARGKDFVKAVQNMIRKDASVNGLFYISPALNEMVLLQAKIGTYAVESKQYYPLKSERQLMQFEAAMDSRRIL